MRYYETSIAWEGEKMSYPERKIRSIPPRTFLDVLRGKVAAGIGRESLSGGVGRVSREPAVRESNPSQTVDRYVFKNPGKRRKTRPEPFYESGGKIECDAEVMEDYNGKGGLGIILQFAGIRFTQATFLRSRHNRPDNPVFYIPINHNKRISHLIIGTRGEDILDIQIVPDQMDFNPFFQKELFLPQFIPQFTATYNSTSMTVLQNNNVVTVGYNPRIY